MAQASPIYGWYGVRKGTAFFGGLATPKDQVRIPITPTFTLAMQAMQGSRLRILMPRRLPCSGKRDVW